MKLLWNDRIVNDTEAVISVYDHGFLYGMGLFETFRTYDSVPFLLDKHMRRLSEGCRELGIRYTPNLERVREQLSELLHENKLVDAYVRFTVTAGEGAVGLPSGEYDTPTVIVYMKELPTVSPSLYEQGRPLQRLKLRRNTPEGSVRLKSLHYMNNINAKRELAQYSWSAGAEGLFLDRQEHIAEGIVSNVFFVRGGGLYTPSIETGILPGITREAVLEIAGGIKSLSTETGLYSWEQLKQADEVFLTNSIQELVPVTTLLEEDGSAIRISRGRIGPVTERLLKEYRRWTMSERQ
jgi:4-amino-4-deoxychorismate lyase